MLDEQGINNSGINQDTGTTNQNLNTHIADTLNNKHHISAQQHREHFASAPQILKDTFILQEDGSFLVKTPDKSKVMNGHFRDFPIVPGIVLKRLFFHQTQNKPKGIITMKFLLGVFEGQTITVRQDGIYNPAGIKLVDIILDTQEEIELSDINGEIIYREMTEPLDHYLLQQNAFRFVDKGEKEGAMKDGTHFRGQYKIPEDFPRQEDGIISPEIIEEISAQIGSYTTGPDLNKNIPLIKKIEDQIKVNPDSKIFTFKIGKSLASNITAKAGETIYVKGKIIKFDPNGKEAHFCYIAENSDHQPLLSGEIRGNVVSIKVLNYMRSKVI